MKKFVVVIFSLCVYLTLISWGKAGHETIALIAQNHLLNATKSSINSILGDLSMENVSNEANDFASDSENSYTIPWHYLNVPEGLDSIQFRNYVINGTKPNVYINLLINIQYLKHPETIKASSPAQVKKVEKHCLAWVIHEVGDIHQPMHIARSDDEYGNKVIVKVYGMKTNLNALWDNQIITQNKLNTEQMAKEYDTATDEEIKRWQNDDIINWLFESYQISTEIYKEAKQNRNFGADYYTSNSPLVKNRIEKAGIRLAGLLNNIFYKSK